MPVFLHYWGALLHAGTQDAVLRDKLVTFDQRFPEPPVFRYLLARLLATSTEPGVADDARALEIATKLHASQPSPPHTELLALALAASGEFAQAQQLQQGLVNMAWMAGAFAHAVVWNRRWRATGPGVCPSRSGHYRIRCSCRRRRTRSW